MHSTCLPWLDKGPTLGPRSRDDQSRGPHRSCLDAQLSPLRPEIQRRSGPSQKLGLGMAFPVLHTGPGFFCPPSEMRKPCPSMGEDVPKPTSRGCVAGQGPWLLSQAVAPTQVTAASEEAGPPDSRMWKLKFLDRVLSFSVTLGVLGSYK